jgi:hypothetical protein
VLTSDAVLEAAFTWVCQRRLPWSPNADIWWLRRDWRDAKATPKDCRFTVRRGPTAGPRVTVPMPAARP